MGILMDITGCCIENQKFLAIVRPIIFYFPSAIFIKVAIIII